MKAHKFWGPLIGFEALAGIVGLTAYRWMRLHPALHAVWPWVLARAAGLGAYGLLTVLVLLGIGMSHPRWKRGLARPLYGWHRSLALGVFALIALHGTALALDPYAKIPWLGLMIPGLAHYRPLAVGFGVLSAEGLLLIAVTAHGAQNWGRLKWMTIHRAALVTWGLALFHSLWSGTDTRSLAVLYEVSAVIVGLATLWRYGTERAARLSPVRAVNPPPGLPSWNREKRDLREHVD